MIWTKISITHLKPSIYTVFYTCLLISSLVQSDVKGICKGPLLTDGLIDNGKKLAFLFKTYPTFKTRNHTLFETKMAKNKTLFLTKSA